MACFAARSDKGPVRETNQDACCVLSAQSGLGEVLMAVMCDGVGGLSSGEVASASVVQAFGSWFERVLPHLVKRMPRGFDVGMVQASWESLLAQLNEAIHAHGCQRGTRMGTTFTGVIACGTTMLVSHVGDCRLYRVRASDVTQLTDDQTLVAWQLAQGQIERAEARTHPLRHVILQAIGADTTLEPCFFEETCEEGDLLVLCTDGAYGQAGRTGLLQVFCEDGWDVASLDAACARLLALDLARGETDNLSVACFWGMRPSAGQDNPPDCTLAVSGSVAR